MINLKKKTIKSTTETLLITMKKRYLLSDARGFLSSHALEVSQLNTRRRKENETERLFCIRSLKESQNLE